MIQQHLRTTLHQIVEFEIQNNVSIGRIYCILNLIQFSCEERNQIGLTLGIMYTDPSGWFDDFPIWKIVWTKQIDPIESKRIEEILKWIFVSNRKADILDHMPRYFSKCQEQNIVFKELNREVISFPVADIIYLSAEGEFSRVFHGHSSELKSNLIDLSIGKAESLLVDFRFYRIHRSYLVNSGCICKMQTFSALSNVVLCSGTELPIARRRKGALIEMFNQTGRLTGHS